jgi:pyruvate,water dikinase
MPGAGAGARYTRQLNELSRDDAARFGGKSASLGELLRAEIPVPPGFALSTAAFDRFVDESALEPTIEAALAAAAIAATPATGATGATGATDDVDAVAAASRVIGEAMHGAPVPESVRAEVASRYEELAAQVGVASPPVAVRSSALGEDSQDATFAGQQETYLWVRGVEDVCDAIRDCWASLYSPPAISYRARLGAAGAEHPAMGVTVQLMVDAVVSGVMFTCNPVTGDPSMVAINASWGLGLAVVGGEVTPDDYLVSKVTREVVRERLGTKSVQYVPDPEPGGRGTVRVDVPAQLRTQPCLDDEAVRGLVELSRRVQAHFGSHQDIEWAIARTESEPDALFVVQSRPVTAVPKRKRTPPAASALSLVMGTFGAGSVGADRPPAGEDQD